jgi:ribose transport system permease protein
MSVPVPADGASRLRRGQGQALSVVRNYGVAVVFVVLFLVLTVSSDPFFSSTNLLNILDQNAAVGLIAVGTTIVLIAGGFDLSVGATYALAGVVSAKLAADVDPILGLVCGVLTGAVVGLLNGVLTSTGRLNPFIATLAMAIVVGGVSVAISGGSLIAVRDDTFSKLGTGDVGGLTYAAIVWLALGAILGFVLWRTKFGRYVYATGGNEEAARLSGVRSARVRSATYVISGTLAALAGVIVASRVGTGQAAAGGFDIAVVAIAGVVVGGTSILGGEGAIWRTIVGVLLLALIGNGFVLLDVGTVYQDIVRGGIILLAVGIDSWARGARGS